MWPPYTNRWNLETDSRVQRNPRASNPRASMPPPVGDAAQTPEPRSSSGIASVFKSLTGGKITKSPSTQSPATGPLQLDNGSVPQKLGHGGTLNYEPALEQLQAGHSLPDRIRAAEYLRHAVIDYPLENVGTLDRDLPNDLLILIIGSYDIHSRQRFDRIDSNTASTSCGIRIVDRLCPMYIFE